MKTLHFLTSVTSMLPAIITILSIILVVVILLCIFFFRCGVSCGAREHAGTYITPAVAATYFKKQPFIVKYVGQQGGQYVYQIQRYQTLNNRLYICDTLFELKDDRHYTFDDAGSLILWGSTNDGDFFDY